MKDICGVPPEGTGILHLRKSIIQTKYKYDASSEDRQTVWKRMIINFIERYFYLVCFAAYAKVCFIIVINYINLLIRKQAPLVLWLRKRFPFSSPL